MSDLCCTPIVDNRRPWMKLPFMDDCTYSSRHFTRLIVILAQYHHMDAQWMRAFHEMGNRERRIDAIIHG